jgi:hypothetical protein
MKGAATATLSVQTVCQIHPASYPVGPTIQHPRPHDMSFHDNRIHLITGAKYSRVRATGTFRGLMESNVLGLY